MTTTSKVPEQAGPPQVDLVRKFFDQPQNYLERKRFDMRVRAETTKTFLEGAAYSKLIDIGCGDGSVSLPLLSLDRHLTLLDISPTMLSLARSRVPSDLTGNVKITQDDFLRAPFENNSYDVVICMGVLAHVASPLDVVRKAAALLKPGGTLILECTDSRHFVRRFMGLPSGFLALFRPSEYKLNQLTSEEVLSMTAKQGLGLKRTFRYSWPPPGSQRIFSQDVLYRVVRKMFGDAHHSRNQWLGFEHIFCLSRPDLGSKGVAP
jgi:2-polyprenyl-3-methyl-5-hydroxy-6-metoxy-1,4-benzoquinol methylase